MSTIQYPPSPLYSTAGGGLVSLLALTYSSCTTLALGTITLSWTVCMCMYCMVVVFSVQSDQCEAEH